jgi:hypothetical protein
MVALEEFNNHLVAVIGFLTAVAWIAYKLDWFKRISEWYSSKIEDSYGIILPSLLALLFPFIFTYLSSNKIPEIVKIVLPIASFALGQSFQFNKDVTQKVETWKFYLEDELFNIAFDLRQGAYHVSFEANILFNEDINHEVLIRSREFIINPINKIQSESLLKTISLRYLPDQAIIVILKRISRLIKDYNKLVEKREIFIQTYDDSSESRLSLISIDEKLFRTMVFFVGPLEDLSNRLDLKAITLEASSLRNNLYDISSTFGLSGIIALSQS